MTVPKTYFCNECQEEKPVKAEGIPSSGFVSLYCSSCGTGPLTTVRKDTQTVIELKEITVFNLLSNVKPDLYLENYSIYELNRSYIVIDKQTWEYMATRETLQAAVSVCLNLVLEKRGL